MSEARVKAKEEIDTYRAELEASFQQKKEMVRDWCWLVMVQATGAGSQKEVEELTAQTNAEIETMKQAWWRDVICQQGLRTELREDAEPDCGLCPEREPSHS